MNGWSTWRRSRKLRSEGLRSRTVARILTVLAWIGAAAGVAIIVHQSGPLVLMAIVAGLLGLFFLTTRTAAGVLLGVFLIFSNWPVSAAQQGLLPREAAAAVGLLFLPALAHHVIVRGRPFRVDRTFGLMLAFLGALLVSSFRAVDPDLALARVGVFAMEGLVVYLLVVNVVRDLPTLRNVLAVILVAAGLLSAVAVYQAATGSFDATFAGLSGIHPNVAEGLEVPPDGVRAERRVRGPVDDPNRFAQVLLLAAPLAFMIFRRGRRPGHRTLAAGAGLLILAAVLLTYSRGAFLTLAILVLALGLLGHVRPSRLTAAALVAALLVPTVVPGYMDRIRSIAGAVGLFDADAPVEPDAVTRGRTTEMLAALLVFREHPVVGVGPGQYMPHYSVEYQLRPEIRFRELPTPRRAHNLYLEVAAETGAVGLAIFLLIPGLLVRDFWRLRRRLRERGTGDGGKALEMAALADGFILGIVAYLGTGVFLHLAFERYLWFFLALAAASVAIFRNRLREDAAESRAVDAPARRSIQADVAYPSAATARRKHRGRPRTPARAPEQPLDHAGRSFRSESPYRRRRTFW